MIIIAMILSAISIGISSMALFIVTRHPKEIEVEIKDPYEKYRNKEGLLTRKPTEVKK